jgi:hypothetical protein
LGEDLPPLEALLRDPRAETQTRLAEILVDAPSSDVALERALELAAGLEPVLASGSESLPLPAAVVAG